MIFAITSTQIYSETSVSKNILKWIFQLCNTLYSELVSSQRLEQKPLSPALRNEQFTFSHTFSYSSPQYKQSLFSFGLSPNALSIERSALSDIFLWNLFFFCRNVLPTKIELNPLTWEQIFLNSRRKVSIIARGYKATILFFW